MEISFFLAKFWGGLLVILCLNFLLRRKTLLEEMRGEIEDRKFILLSGYLALTLGLTTVILHNIWTTDWRIIITLLGWFSLIRGITRISFPETIQKIMPILKNKPALRQILLIIGILLGTWLIWISY